MNCGQCTSWQPPAGAGKNYRAFRSLLCHLSFMWIFGTRRTSWQEYSVTAIAERGIAYDLIEKLCYIVVDYDTELKSIEHEKTCELTNCSIISVGAERLHCVSLLFQPSFMAKRPADSTTHLSRTTRIDADICRRHTRPQTKTSSPSVPNVSVARKCFLSFPAKCFWQCSQWNPRHFSPVLYPEV